MAIVHQDIEPWLQLVSIPMHPHSVIIKGIRRYHAAFSTTNNGGVIGDVGLAKDRGIPMVLDEIHGASRRFDFTALLQNLWVRAVS